VSKAEFEKGYREHLAELVRKFAGKPAEKVLSFKELETALAKEPNNPDLNARVGSAICFWGTRRRRPSWWTRRWN